MLANLRWPMVFGACLLIASAAALAEKKYGPGVTDTEIKLGQTIPYSGNVSTAGTIGRTELAYFAMINAQGGVNGRKIRLLSLDDGFSPPKTVEQTRKLVEQEQVLAIFSSVGTAPNSAIHRYLNARAVPHVFLSTGATKWADPKNFPWTIGWLPSYQTESRIYARYLLSTRPSAKIGVLYQNDDYGKDYLKGLKDGLRDKASLILMEASYEATDSTVDSQLVALQASGADTLFIFAGPKQAAQAVRKAYDIGWRPSVFLNNVSASVATVLAPAGLERSVGIVTALYMKDPTDPQWTKDKGFQNWLAFVKKWYPEGSTEELYNVWGYSIAQTMVQVIKQCGEDLTRENLMRQAANLHDLELPMLLPGIRLNTSPTDFFAIKQLQLMRFDGKTWVRSGELVSR